VSASRRRSTRRVLPLTSDFHLRIVAVVLPKTNTRARSRRKRKRRSALAKYFPSARTRKRWWRSYRRTTPRMQIIVGLLAIATLWLATNWIYQVARKPTELFFPVSGALYKTPAETWSAYAPIFRRHATAIMTPELLAALAQVEGSGNPVVRTYWRWSFSRKPFEVYKPASSAVGMYQITDGTFDESRRLCIHNHVVVEDGPWNDVHSCWFNSLYMRVIPTNAVEMTSAYLDRHVNIILANHRLVSASLQHKQELATLIHLCGAGTGESYVQRGFRLTPHQKCGDHEAAIYIQRVDAMKNVFARMNAADN
jgi:hypothetical protein